MMMRDDPRFPGVGMALDTSAVLDLLDGHLRAAGESVTLRGVEVQDVRYEPGRRCELLYRVKGDHRRTGKSTRQLLAGRVIPIDEQPRVVSATLLDRYAALDLPLVSTPFLFFERPRLQLLAHPLDPDMPTLFDALDPDAVAAGLTRMWAGRNTKAHSVRIEPLGYTPHSRAAFGYEVLAETRRTREPELRRLIGKMHAKKPAARLFAGSWALWTAAKHRVALAPPVGFLSSLNLTFQERVKGERLGSLAASSSFARHIRTTARYSARLHRLNVPLSTQRTPQDEAAVVHRWSSMLIAIRPDLAGRIERLRDQLAQALETNVQPSGPVHGDFHHTNVLVDGDQVTIIDLDEMAFGDPLLDVGRFIASLRIPSLRTFGNLDGLMDVRELYLREYMRHNPEDERRVRLFEAATLFTAAASAFRIQRASWSDEVELLVTEAERVFETSRAGSPSAVQAPAPACQPASVPQWDRDPLYMRAALAPDVEREYGAELTDLEIGEQSPTDERVFYRAQGYCGQSRWKAALVGTRSGKKGTRTLQRMTTLRNALRDDEDAPDLPRPIGYIRELGLLVFEELDGTPLISLMDHGDGARAGARLGRALAAVHRVTMPLERARSLADELSALRRDIAALRKTHRELHKRASDVYDALAPRYRLLPEALGPTIRVRPQHVHYRGDRVVFARVDDVTLAHPFIDVADFLARLRMAGIQQMRTHAAGAVTHRFRAAYESAAGLELTAAAPVEASALLRLACEQAQGDRTATLADALVDRAMEVLGL